MKAAIRTIYGSAESIQLNEIDKPKPLENEVLIKIKATTVNRTDCAILTGKPVIMRIMLGLTKPSKQGLGTDFAGIVEGVGKNVEQFSIGDRVWGFNDMGLSTQTEYVCLSEKIAISKIPSFITFENAVASAEGAHYAFNIMNKVEIKHHHKVLVYGATGAIGSALVQIVKSLGAFVTAVGNTENMERLKVLSADKYVDYLKTDFTKDETQYDFVFDAVGKSSFSACKPLLTKKGVYISSELGQNGQNIWLSLFTPLFGAKKVIFPLPKNIKASLDFMNKLLETGQFKPLIDKTYKLNQIREAYEYVLSGKKLGNVILSLE